MTRRAVYGCGLLLTLVCTAMTIASIIVPRWISYSPNDERELWMGLHKQCSRITGLCRPFPQSSDCGKENFCHMWRTVGFLISFSVVIELATLVSFAVIVAGGVQRRTAGWQVSSSLLAFGGIVQCAAMAMIAYIFNHSNRFYDGWYLDVSFKLATASWSILILSAFALGASALYLPEEGGYELVPDYQVEVQQDEQLQSRISSWNDGYREDGYQNEGD